jgi:adenine C2-methylase RlmN of 23S rRNA A2503 and tRNA A37
MNCQFCFTGRMGLQQNLTTAQIVEQLVEARRYLSQEGAEATNVVFMGMGVSLAFAVSCCQSAVSQSSSRPGNAICGNVVSN